MTMFFGIDAKPPILGQQGLRSTKESHERGLGLDGWRGLQGSPAHIRFREIIP